MTSAEPGASSDAVAAAAEAQMAQHAGDVGEWLGVDSGATVAAAQVALAEQLPGTCRELACLAPPIPARRLPLRSMRG